jgi:TonB-dependent SusC/RagA subfamily outer membrane receptor
MKSIILSLLFLLCCYTLFSQEKYIKGIVTTFDSLALIGADVQVKSSKEMIKTDSLGCFNAKVSANDKLKISAKGFVSKSIKIEEKTKLVAVNLEIKPTPKAQEYAIGYGYVKDREKLNALCQLTNDKNNFSKYSNMYDLIRGRFPGVQVQGTDIIIRGQGSINSSNTALIIIDDVTANSSALSYLVPSNVKSINVIKDSGASIYGVRGANGVVIIKTKSGGDE